MRVLWLGRGARDCALSLCVVLSSVSTWEFFQALLRSVNAFRTIFVFFTISHGLLVHAGLLILAVDILISAFVELETF